MDKYIIGELIEVLQVISSSISNCEKIQPKFAEDASHHTRFNNLIKAMYISKSLITDKISKRNYPY